MKQLQQHRKENKCRTLAFGSDITKVPVICQNCMSPTVKSFVFAVKQTARLMRGAPILTPDPNFSRAPPRPSHLARPPATSAIPVRPV